MKNGQHIPDPVPVDPVQAGAGVYDSMVERAAAAERRGFIALMSGIAFGISGAAALGYMIFRGPPPPLLAEMCRGDVLAVRTVDMPAGRPALEDIAEDLKKWVRGAREVSFDRDFVGRQAWKAYDLTRRGSQAEVDLQGFHRTNDPMERAKTVSVKLERQTAMPEGGKAASNTWLLEWTEITKQRDGVVVSRVDWRMQVSFVLNPPVTRDELNRNPHGIFVESFHWEDIRTRPRLGPQVSVRPTQDVR